MGSGCDDAPRLPRGQHLSMLCWEIDWFPEMMVTCSISEFTRIQSSSSSNTTIKSWEQDHDEL